MEQLPILDGWGYTVNYTVNCHYTKALPQNFMTDQSESRVPHKKLH